MSESFAVYFVVCFDDEDNVYLVGGVKLDEADARRWAEIAMKEPVRWRKPGPPFKRFGAEAIAAATTKRGYELYLCTVLARNGAQP